MGGIGLDKLAGLDDQKGKLEPLVPFDKVLLSSKFGDIGEDLAKAVVGHLDKRGRREGVKRMVARSRARVTRG
jgi:hypothetical protein